MKIVVLPLLTASALAPLSAILAQEGPSPLAVSETITVTAERGPRERGEVPASTTVMTREQIETLPALSAADLVDLAPGITTLHSTALGKTFLTARGFFGGGEAEYLQLRIDGVPVEDSETGLSPLASLPADAIERIEILTGPASSIYGDNALAGVIEVFTRRSGSSRGSATVAAGTNSSGSVEAYLAGEGPSAARLFASVHRTSGDRDHAEADQLFVDGSGSLEAGRGVLTGRVMLIGRERDEPGLLPFSRIDSDPNHSLEMFADDFEEERRGLFSLHWRHSLRPFRTDAWVAARDGSRRQTVLLAAGLGDSAEREIESWSAGAAAVLDGETTIAGFPVTLRGGGDLQHDDLRSTYFPAGDTRATPLAKASGSRQRLATFGTGSIHLREGLIVHGGLRLDLVHDDFDASTTHTAFSPRIGMSWEIPSGETATASAWLAASRAFKAPTLDQMFDVRPYPDFQGGSFTISSQDLQPQRATNLEAGVSGSSASGLRWDLTGYQMWVEDEIDFDARTFRYANIGSSIHRGLESSLRGSAGRLTPHIGWTWTRVLPEGERSLQLKNIPEHVVEGGVGISLTETVILNLTARHLSSWFADDDNRVPMPDALEANLRLTTRFDRWEARLDVLNLTDEITPRVGVVLPDFSGGSVAYGYPAEGRRVRLAVTHRF